MLEPGRVDWILRQHFDLGLGLGVARGFELAVLLVKVAVKLLAFYNGSVGLFDLVGVQINEDEFDVVDKLVDP